MHTQNAHNYRFPVEEWGLSENEFHSENQPLTETLFAQANGYIGTRGTYGESVSANVKSTEGTYINGVYLREKIFYDENAYGFATHNNKMIQVPDGKGIRVIVDGEVLLPGASAMEHYERHLNFKTGQLTRKVVWASSSGKHLEITSRRFASLAQKHLLLTEYSVRPLNFSGEVHLESYLDAAYGQDAKKDENDPRAGHLSIASSLEELDAQAEGETLSYLHKVKGGQFIIASGALHTLSVPATSSPLTERGKIGLAWKLNIKEGETVTLTKYVAYHHGAPREEHGLRQENADILATAAQNGYAYYANEQERILARFWERSDVVMEGDPALQQGMRFNLLHLFLSVGRDGKSNIAAKGLTGPGYDGHYFWDTEIYIIPLFVYTNPEIARKLLEYRYSILDKARERARQMAHEKGALYAWRTIGGEECSSYFPAGTAQYHINAAIAYAIRQYYDATLDWEFMVYYGAEMLAETARIWIGLGQFSERHDGKFCIYQVTGPDEYSAMVDNNFYTNAMAQTHLESAVAALEKMQADNPAEYKALAKTLQLGEEEIATWKKAAQAMYLPTDARLGISPQNDSFLAQPRWDFAGTPKDKYPLLLHFHPLVIYRHQVLKQADVVLAMYLLGEKFDDELKRRNFEYYEPLTTHDSTLSSCIYGIAAAEIGKYKESYHFFGDSVRMDIDNHHHNTEYGLHTACMAGSWQGVVMGFGGMRAREGRLSFKPHLPHTWQGYRFRVNYRGAGVEVHVSGKHATYTLFAGEQTTIFHNGEEVVLTNGKPVTCNGILENAA